MLYFSINMCAARGKSNLGCAASCEHARIILGSAARCKWRFSCFQRISVRFSMVILRGRCSIWWGWRVTPVAQCCWWANHAPVSLLVLRIPSNINFQLPMVLLVAKAGACPLTYLGLLLSDPTNLFTGASVQLSTPSAFGFGYLSPKNMSTPCRFVCYVDGSTLLLYIFNSNSGKCSLTRTIQWRLRFTGYQWNMIRFLWKTFKQSNASCWVD